ncbi:MAG: cupin domain-containing protein [Gammaproteobacteria bacterium]|jgi:anti-sigma factor ChrR (cupin superfamily)|nr:cupin domain-containing protein [Gammaproteobacteria bacterium]
MDRAASIVLKDLCNLSDAQAKFHWQPFRQGVEIYRLYGDETNGPAAALLKYDPGADIPLHHHTGYEHILVLAGSQSDDQAEYDQGTLIISKPGSGHSVTSTSGCIVLAIWNSPVEFAP